MRWHRFSLKSLIASMVLSTLVFVWLIHDFNTRKDELAAEMVESLGGRIVRYPQTGTNQQSGREVILANIDLSNRNLEFLGDIQDLHGLHLHNTKITDGQLDEIGRVDQLEWLILSANSLTDASLPRIQQINHLRELHLGSTQISNEGIARLRFALPHCIISHDENPEWLR